MKKWRRTKNLMRLITQKCFLFVPIPLHRSSPFHSLFLLCPSFLNCSLPFVCAVGFMSSRLQTIFNFAAIERTTVVPVQTNCFILNTDSSSGVEKASVGHRESPTRNFSGFRRSRCPIFGGGFFRREIPASVRPDGRKRLVRRRPPLPGSTTGESCPTTTGTSSFSLSVSQLSRRSSLLAPGGPPPRSA